jgi:hypothetical protein
VLLFPAGKSQYLGIRSSPVYEEGGTQQLEMQLFDDANGIERNERLKDGHRGKFGQRHVL